MTPTLAGDRRPLIVLMPVYNDWEVVPHLLAELDRALIEADLTAEVVIADDGSVVVPGRELFAGARYRALASITVLHLGRNVGHQRAIAIGLAYIDAKRPCCAVVVMDADGEDAPTDVPRLVRAWATADSAVIFATRARRSEGVPFRALYRAYRLAYRLLTGSWISFGNFSLVPARLLPRLTLLAELWNHYPAAVMKARIPIATIRVDRARRLAGHSQMTLVSLVLHGLSAISVYGDVIGVRALLATVVAIGLCLGGIAVVVGIRFMTDLAIPGWASAVVGLLVAILLQTVSLSLVFVFMILNSRNYSTVIPRRDYGDYVAAEERIYP